MKLNSIFKLYKSCYPSVSVQRVTLSATGGMLRMTDVRRSFRLSLFSLQSLGDMSRRESLERNAATREFMDDNRREMFMLGETRCLYGIVYAENLGYDLRLMSMITQNSELPRTGCERIRFTYLFALADRLSQARYSADSITVERNGTAIITCGTPENRCVVKVEPGGKVCMARKGENVARRVYDDASARYARLFWRDNAGWFANFAAGREDLL